jgi:hypothetical protein
MDTSERLGVQCDLGVEDVGNRAVLLGVAGHPSEGGFVKVRHLAAQSQGRPIDAEAMALWVKSDRRLSEGCSRRPAAQRPGPW